MENKSIEDAVFIPKTSKEARKVFDFVSRNSNLRTERSGMQSITTGLDRYKLVTLAKDFNIDLTKYDFFLTLYESYILKLEKKHLEKR